ncbi:MAG TPA: hypothetical protein PK079_07805 [Leptospiraceae bacterium]|nr:hypothetical protein [Leptospiraceae bacterium]HMW06044.1 hypothetical protein [Leptospiraceae bacterium]HMX35301.1 hypothetical protein [Leptospiraceae bacterium]HMY31414.1 hypothetical protein [Leptospiraceae bacterium]HMZ67253.1 hypothetical protein [Leptospiraceae bacterium]
MEEENNIKEELEHLTSLYLFEEINSEEKNRLFSILNSSPIYKAEFSELKALNDQLVKEKDLTQLEKNPSNKIFIFKKKFYIPLTIAAVLLFGLFLQKDFTKEKIEIGILEKKEYGKCNLKTKVDTVSYQSDKYSICEVVFKTKNLYQILLYPESNLTATLDNSHLTINQFSGIMILDSHQISKEETLQIKLNSTYIHFYGTKIKLESHKEKKISVLEGKIGIQNDPTNKETIVSRGEETNWNQITPVVPISKNDLKTMTTISEILKKQKASSNQIDPVLVEEILHKKESVFLSKIAGKKVLLKSGKSIVAISIFQKDTTYLIFTEKEVIQLESVEVESIEFE